MKSKNIGKQSLVVAISIVQELKIERSKLPTMGQMLKDQLGIF